jgi:hypothetical protein
VVSPAPKLSDQDFRQWKLLDDFRARLKALLQAAPPAHHSWSDPKRQLEPVDYLCLFLFALVNPTVKTLNAICAASQLQRVQQEVCTRPTSAGAFSEAQHLLEPHLLEKLIESLSAEVPGPLPPDPHQDWPLWLARDSSIFPALARMSWAQYGAGKAGCPNRAVRLHVSFHLLEDKPVRVAVTPGRVCERKVWRDQLQPGATYVGDRYFAEDYKMFARLQEEGCHFVLRLRDEAVAQVEEEIPVAAEARAAGVMSDTWVRLGVRARYRTERLRVLTLRKDRGTVMRLVTNFPPEAMSARELQVLYRRRWQIECFFRWLKCLLGCRHWLAQSAPGATTQLYLAIIAGLMLQLVLGTRPNQRLWECLQLYLAGWATLEELLSAVQKAQGLALKKS